MGKKRQLILDHQTDTANHPHQHPHSASADHQNQHHQGGGNGMKKRSSSSAVSEESQLLNKLNTHFKKLSKTRSKTTPPSAPAANVAATVNANSTAATVMHACIDGGSPSNSSSTTSRFNFDANDDHRHSVVAFKLLDYTTSFSGESETTSSTVTRTKTTTSFVVGITDTGIEELFGGNFTFAPDLNAAHTSTNLVHLEFVDGVGAGFGSSTYLTDPISLLDIGFAKYTSDMLKLCSPEEMIQEFLKNNLFD